VEVNAFLLRIVWIMTTTKMLGYLNCSRAIENYIWIARRAIYIVEKYLTRRLMSRKTCIMWQFVKICLHEENVYFLCLLLKNEICLSKGLIINLTKIIMFMRFEDFVNKNIELYVHNLYLENALHLKPLTFWTQLSYAEPRPN